jgi:hypothetical protein
MVTRRPSTARREESAWKPSTSTSTADDLSVGVLTDGKAPRPRGRRAGASFLRGAPSTVVRLVGDFDEGLVGERERAGEDRLAQLHPRNFVLGGGPDHDGGEILGGHLDDEDVGPVAATGGAEGRVEEAARTLREGGT